MSQKLGSKATLFFDTGNGRNTEESVAKEIYLADTGWSTVTVQFDVKKIALKDDIQSVLFRPCESLLPIIRNIEARDVDKNININIKAINNEYAQSNGADQLVFFLTVDPLFSLETSNFSTIRITYDIRTYTNFEVCQIFENKNQIITQKDSVINTVNGLKYQLKKRFNNVSSKEPEPVNNVFDTQNWNSTIEPIAASKKSNENKKKILFVVHSGEKHGPVLMFKNLIEIAKNEYKIDPLILVLTSDFIRKDFEELGYVYDLDINYFDINLRKSELKKFLQQAKDIGCFHAVCNSLTTGIVADSLKENRFHITQLVHEMPELVEFNNLSNAAALAFKYADDLVFPAEYVLQQYLARGIKFKGKTHIFPQGLYNVKGLSEYSEKAKYKTKICRQLGCDKNSNIVLGCGTGYLVKGIDYFVDVAIDVIRKLPNTQFIWIGHFDQAFDNMGKILAQRQIKLAGMEENIHLFDFVDNPADYFAAADIYFLPSRNDTFPSTVLEAAASFTPSVIFEGAGGAQDFVEDGVNGKVVEFSNTESASGVIMNSFSKWDMVKEFARNAHDKSSCYDMNVYVEQVLKISYLTNS